MSGRVLALAQGGSANRRNQKESINLIKQNHQPTKQEVQDGIRRKQKSFRHATRFSQDIGRRRRGRRPRTRAFGAVRVDRLGPNQDVESAAVESLRSPVRYLVRWLREGLGKKERHHRHYRSHSPSRGTGARRGGGCGRGRTRPGHVQRLWWAAPVREASDGSHRPRRRTREEARQGPADRTPDRL